jgi:hypothetical protein
MVQFPLGDHPGQVIFGTSAVAHSVGRQLLPTHPTRHLQPLVTARREPVDLGSANKLIHRELPYPNWWDHLHIASRRLRKENLVKNLMSNTRRVVVALVWASDRSPMIPSSHSGRQKGAMTRSRSRFICRCILVFTYMTKANNIFTVPVHLHVRTTSASSVKL